MDYGTDSIIASILAQMKKKRISKVELSENVNISRQTLENYIIKNELPLSTFIRICHYLELNPSIFFGNENALIVNESNLNYATGGKNRQTNVQGAGANEVELLKQRIESLETQIKLKDEIIELLKTKK